MPRLWLSLLVLVSFALVAFGGIADVALQGQASRARETAAQAAGESARLVALSVRATLAQVEQGVLWGRTERSVVWERLASPPARAIPDAAAVPYSRRSRAELARLLHSTEATASGLPEAVVARLALGEATPVSAPGEMAPPDVSERLLSGGLPVRPEDLRVLARALGVSSDARARLLQERLRAAPDPAALPAAPGFLRARQGDVVEGWTRRDGIRIRYQIPLVALLERARVPGGTALGAAAAGSPLESGLAEVPDVAGLSLRVPARAPDVARIHALRVALWLTIAASIVSLLIVRRALTAEASATARERAFLTSVTHELRTPLSAIRLFGDRLAEGRGDPRAYGTLVAEESLRLEGLVERVLALTRAGERPRFASVEPGEIVRSAVALVAPRAERRLVTLTCHTAPPLPTSTWDEEAVRHALLNLVDNAVKHGREGGHVEVRAGAEGEVVCLSVSDDGPGIGPRERKGLFHRFARGATDAPGTGLGLHFVEQVARAHGGSVELRSKAGSGCVFTLRLPAHPPAAEPA